MAQQHHPRPKKIDPIMAALLDAAEDAEAGVAADHSTHGFSSELRDWKRRGTRRAPIPTFDHPDVNRP